MKLDYRRTFILGFGFFGISVVWSMYNAYVPIFLRDYALPWWLVGFVMTLDNILGITLLPYVGQVSDNTRTRFGRRMPYILIGTPVAAIFLVLMAVLHTALPKVASTFWLVTGAILVMNVAMAVFRTPTVALMPDITPPPLRSKANGVINLMGGLGTTLAFVTGAMLFTRGQAYPFVLAAILLVIAEAIVVLHIKEPSDYSVRQGEEEKRPHLGQALRQTVSNVIDIARSSDKSALFMCLAIFCWFMGYNVIETFWTSYGKGVLYQADIASGLLTEEQAVAKAASMLTYLSGAFLVFALPAGFIATRFGRKPTILTGLALLVILWLGMSVIHSRVYMQLVLVVSGIAWALININSLPIMADLAPEEKVGSFTGLYYFFSMLAASTSPTVAGWLIDLADLRIIVVFAPVFMLLAFFCMLGVRRSEPAGAPSVDQALRMVADADF